MAAVAARTGAHHCRLSRVRDVEMLGMHVVQMAVEDEYGDEVLKMDVKNHRIFALFVPVATWNESGTWSTDNASLSQGSMGVANIRALFTVVLAVKAMNPGHTRTFIEMLKKAGSHEIAGYRFWWITHVPPSSGGDQNDPPGAPGAGPNGMELNAALYNVLQRKPLQSLGGMCSYKYDGKSLKTLLLKPDEWSAWVGQYALDESGRADPSRLGCSIYTMIQEPAASPVGPDQVLTWDVSARAAEVAGVDSSALDMHAYFDYVEGEGINGMRFPCPDNVLVFNPYILHPGELCKKALPHTELSMVDHGDIDISALAGGRAANDAMYDDTSTTVMSCAINDLAKSMESKARVLADTELSVEERMSAVDELGEAASTTLTKMFNNEETITNLSDAQRAVMQHVTKGWKGEVAGTLETRAPITPVAELSPLSTLLVWSTNAMENIMDVSKLHNEMWLHFVTACCAFAPRSVHKTVVMYVQGKAAGGKSYMVDTMYEFMLLPGTFMATFYASLRAATTGFRAIHCAVSSIDEAPSWMHQCDMTKESDATQQRTAFQQCVTQMDRTTSMCSVEENANGEKVRKLRRFVMEKVQTVEFMATNVPASNLLDSVYTRVHDLGVSTARRADKPIQASQAAHEAKLEDPVFQMYTMQMKLRFYDIQSFVAMVNMLLNVMNMRMNYRAVQTVCDAQSLYMQEKMGSSINTRAKERYNARVRATSIIDGYAKLYVMPGAPLKDKQPRFQHWRWWLRACCAPSEEVALHTTVTCFSDVMGNIIQARNVLCVCARYLLRTESLTERLYMDSNAFKRWKEDSGDVPSPTELIASAGTCIAERRAVLRAHLRAASRALEECAYGGAIKEAGLAEVVARSIQDRESVNEAIVISGDAERALENDDERTLENEDTTLPPSIQVDLDSDLAAAKMRCASGCTGKVYPADMLIIPMQLGVFVKSLCRFWRQFPQGVEPMDENQIVCALRAMARDAVVEEGDAYRVVETEGHNIPEVVPRNGLLVKEVQFSMGEARSSNGGGRGTWISKFYLAFSMHTLVKAEGTNPKASAMRKVLGASRTRHTRTCPIAIPSRTRNDVPQYCDDYTIEPDPHKQTVYVHNPINLNHFDAAVLGVQRRQAQKTRAIEVDVDASEAAYMELLTLLGTPAQNVEEARSHGMCPADAVATLRKHMPHLPKYGVALAAAIRSLSVQQEAVRLSDMVSGAGGSASSSPGGTSSRIRHRSSVSSAPSRRIRARHEEVLE